MPIETTSLFCGRCGAEALHLVHAKTAAVSFICSSPKCPNCTEWHSDETAAKLEWENAESE